MILGTWSETGIGLDDIKYKTGYIGRRWALVLNKNGFGAEYQGRNKVGGWFALSSYAGLYWRLKGWQWGYKELEYDGVHKSFAIGLAAFNWCL